MKHLITVLSFCLCSFFLQAQVPTEIITFQNIRDAIYHKDTIYASSAISINRIDSSETVPLIERPDYEYYYSGDFYHYNDSWVHLHGDYFELDFAPPVLLFSWENQGSVESKRLEHDGVYVDSYFTSFDSIMILEMPNFGDFRVLTIDSTSMVKSEYTLSTEDLVGFDGLANDSLLLFSTFSLHLFHEGNVLETLPFDDEIHEVNVYSDKRLIEVLTASQHFFFNYDLSLVRTINVLGPAVSCHTHNDTTYVLSRPEPLLSQVHTYVDEGGPISTFQETFGFGYRNIKVQEGIYFLSGITECNGSVLKYGSKKFEPSFFEVDLELTSALVEYLGIENDTIVVSNDTNIIGFHTYNWQAEVTNVGNAVVEDFRMYSNQPAEFALPYVSISGTNLEVQESRSFSGNFRTLVQSFNPNFPTRFSFTVNTPQLDEVCENNGLHVELVNTDDVAANRDFLIYPNPAENIIGIKGLQPPFQYRIYNAAGVQVSDLQNSPADGISVSHLPTGLYLLQLIQHKTTHTKPFIKM